MSRRPARTRSTPRSRRSTTTRLNGITRLTTETGAGQWGTALSYASALFGVTCEVWQVGASFDTKPQRRTLIEVFGGTVHRSPSRLTESGKAFAEDHPGSLGIAISEAVEVAAQDDTAKYALGSVLNHVLLHQSVIGEEAVRQAREGGRDRRRPRRGLRGRRVELRRPGVPVPAREGSPATSRRGSSPSSRVSCPTLTRGEYRYDFGDTAGLTPLMKMHTLGHDFVPSPIHAGGLRYHGMAPLVSHTVNEGLVEAVALHQNECFDAAVEFARTQGIVPAPESSHALAQVRREALAAAQSGTSPVIVVGLSGHGLLESGRLRDVPLRGAGGRPALRRRARRGAGQRPGGVRPCPSPCVARRPGTSTGSSPSGTRPGRRRTPR
ncbi:TrpB-like pyridoxal phosphate-dependent enzyme [Nocardioides sp. W3-2-3]|uniref:TrpB-like pyridoxal phosphate-dependent enzyme n=1 Tax=Nocardioides convexus TaxID=2712224 RepID=UPI00241835EF|nr:TrpB-like pyridoxal phosphate-dependent enzyme [Nocardioides convexus]NHA01588.1 TrpB-like pyridoxal phosphate-dependent enzyme [Nocardioides convexus]